MKLFPFLLRHSRRAVLVAVLAGVVSGAANTAVLALFNSLLAGGGRYDLSKVWAFVALCLTVPLARAISELMMIRLGQGSIYEMRMQMCRRILAVPLPLLESLGAARLNSVLTGDIPTITTFVTMMPTLLINAATVAGCLLYLGWLSWEVLLAVLVTMAVGISTYQIPVIRARRSFQRARDARDRLYEHFRAILEGTKELKLHHRRRQAFVTETLDSAASAYRQHQSEGQRIYAFASSWGQLLVFAVIGLLLFSAPRFLGGAADLEKLTGFTLCLLYLMAPLQVLMNTLPNFGQAEVALKRVEAMGLDLQRHGTEADSVAPPEGSSWKSLELCGVTHVYRREGDDGEFVLGPIDLYLSPGEIVLIAGGNGSGKTTLAKILVGLYRPESGEIRLDGELVTEANLEAYRQHFSAIFSDFYLFEGLIGLEAPELGERARRYLNELQIAGKVEIRDGRLSTTALSQGQRKRLALLTAYLEDRPIYLFDEWAADQDPMFKDLFYRQILPELKRRGKTVVAISHDDRYYSAGDRLIKLESGRLVQEAASSR